MENINDLMLLSKDLNKERFRQLKKLFPDLFTDEGKLNTDELKKVIDPAIERNKRVIAKSQKTRKAERPTYSPTDTKGCAKRVGL